MPLEEVSGWALLGEAIVAFSPRPRRGLAALPKGLKRIPGPVIVLAERFVDSPAGPFMSLAVGEPVRLGVRPGYYFGTSVINSPDARRFGRQHWGFPHELGKLHWTSEVSLKGIVWEERGMEIRAEVSNHPFPVLIPLRTLQRRSDGPVVIPTLLRAMARQSHVEVALPAGDPLFGIAGPHRGLVFSGLVLRRNQARQAQGLFSTLRAPLRAPEPGILG